jgi:hypothetical protein
MLRAPAPGCTAAAIDGRDGPAARASIGCDLTIDNKRLAGSEADLRDNDRVTQVELAYLDRLNNLDAQARSDTKEDVREIR